MFELTDPVDYELDARLVVRRRGPRRRAPTRPRIVYDALLERDGTQLLYLPLFNFAHGSFDDILEMITSPFSLFGLSDAGAHCGAICDASIDHVVARRLGPRPQAAASGCRSSRSSTSRPSAPRDHVGWLDRGRRRPRLPGRPQRHRLRRASAAARPHSSTTCPPAGAG